METKTQTDRKTFIGSSDIAGIMGISRWSTPLQLWAEKTGKVEPKDLSDNEAVELGTELEDFVAQKFQRKTGLKVRRYSKDYAHAEFGYMRAHVDRLIEGTDELLECKTCSAWKAKEWEGEDIPQEYILQVMWQLGITGRRIGHIAVLIGGQSFKYKKIEFDYELFTSMVTCAKSFWDCVINDTPPMSTGADNDFIVELHPDSNEEIQDAEELNDTIALRQETCMHIDELEKQKDEVEAKIKQRIGDNLGVKTSKYLVKWSKERQINIDTAKLKEDGLYDKYKKEGKKRVLRVNLQEPVEVTQ